MCFSRAFFFSKSLRHTTSYRAEKSRIFFSSLVLLPFYTDRIWLRSERVREEAKKREIIDDGKMCDSVRDDEGQKIWFDSALLCTFFCKCLKATSLSSSSKCHNNSKNFSEWFMSPLLSHQAVSSHLNAVKMQKQARPSSSLEISHQRSSAFGEKEKKSFATENFWLDAV